MGRKNQGQTTISWPLLHTLRGSRDVDRKAARRRVRRVRGPCIRAIRLPQQAGTHGGRLRRRRHFGRAGARGGDHPEQAARPAGDRREQAGAGTTIAGDFIVKSPPDGYNLWLQDITTHAINPALYAKLPYDSVRDFTYVAMIASTPLMLVVHPATPAHDVRELIALLKSAPGRYSYGSSGNGTIVHLSAEMLNQASGVDVLHVPYKGSNPATQALLGGEVRFVFSTMPPAVSNASAGKLRALAVTTPKRVAAARQPRTMIEAGLPDFDIVLV